MKFSLRHRLIFVHLLLLLIVTIAAGLIISVQLEKYYAKRLFQQLQTQLDEVEYLLARSAFEHNDAAAHYRLLSGYARAARARLTLIDAQGVVVFESEVAQDSLRFIENHFLRPEVQQALRAGAGGDQRLSATVKKRLFYAAKKVSPRFQNQGGLAGVAFVRLAFPLEEVEAVLRDLRWKIFGGGGAALALIALVSYWASSRLTTPLRKLARVAESVKKGDVEAHFETESRDEIGELAELLNDMLAKLRDDVKQMRKLQTMRSQFLGNVSHELSTPIFAVQGYLETLLDDKVKDEKLQKAFIEKAHRQTQRLNNLLTDLIDISRIETGDMKMSIRYFELEEWLAKQVSELQAAAQHHGITLELLAGAAPVNVLGDRERLAQVITNLVENAIKYNAPNGRVEVGYKDFVEEVEIFVSDTGRGIAEEHLSRVFERFYRVDKERSRAVGGTGLGLAIVKHIIEAHDSHVHVRSQVGKGSTFSFRLKKMNERGLA
jgi:two-component system phosphate regulon sensor histidine kinase PhoR